MQMSVSSIAFPSAEYGYSSSNKNQKFQKFTIENRLAKAIGGLKNTSRKTESSNTDIQIKLKHTEFLAPVFNVYWK